MKREEVQSSGGSGLAAKPSRMKALEAKAPEVKRPAGRESETKSTRPAATRRDQDAAEGAGEAGRRASVPGEVESDADAARARMLSEKQKARKDTMEFMAGLVYERRGDVLSERGAFKDAVGAYREAEARFARTPAPPPAATTPSRP